MGLPSAVLLRTQSDERLVALARDGHERAFETIVRHCLALRARHRFARGDRC